MASLSVYLNEITPEGLHLDCECTRDDLQLEDRDPEFKGTLHLAVDIVSDKDKVFVKGELEGTFLRECVRCLNVFEEPRTIPLLAYFRTQDHQASPPTGGKKVEGELDSEDDSGDSYCIQHNQCQLADMIREQLILATPMQPVCHEGCQGLCQVCGQNLNQGDCACGEVNIASPFSVLRQVMPSSRRP